MKRFIEETTFHGVRDAFSAHHAFVRVTWISIIVVGICFTGRGIYGVFQQFYTQPMSTQIQIGQLKTIPDMSFCPETWLLRSAVLDLSLTNDFLITMASTFTYYTTLMALTNFNPKDNYYPNFTQGFLDLYNLTQNVSDLGNLLMNRSISEKAFACDGCEEGYPKRFINTNGLCFLFHFQENNDLSALAGFVVSFMYQEVPDSISPLPFSKQLLGNLYYSDDVTDMLPKDGIPIARGTTTRVKFHATYFTRMSTRTTQCENDDSKNVKQLCRKNCLQQVSLKMANCTWAFANTTLYDPQDVAQVCMYQSFLGLDDYNTHFLQPLRGCFVSCPDSCTITSYHTSYSHDYILDNVPEMGSVGNVELRFQNADNVVYLTEQPAYSWDALVGDIGGQLGLWLGASLISVLQLFYFIALWCKHFLRKQPLSRTKDVKNFPILSFSYTTNKEQVQVVNSNNDYASHGLEDSTAKADVL